MTYSSEALEDLRKWDTRGNDFFEDEPTRRRTMRKMVEHVRHLLWVLGELPDPYARFGAGDES